MAALAFDRVRTDSRGDGVDFRALLVIGAMGREHEHVSAVRRRDVRVGFQENGQVKQAGGQLGAKSWTCRCRSSGITSFLEAKSARKPLISSYELITE